MINEKKITFNGQHDQVFLFTRAPDKRGFKDNSKDNFFIFLNKNICYDPSLKTSQPDCSTEGSSRHFKGGSTIHFKGELQENYPKIIPFTPYLEQLFNNREESKYSFYFSINKYVRTLD